jgi:hypothetical protein
MRTTYRITTQGDDQDLKLKKVCEFLGTPPLIYNITDGSVHPEDKVINAIVDLSKYELLYVRLTVNIQDITEIKDNESSKTYS